MPRRLQLVLALLAGLAAAVSVALDAGPWATFGVVAGCVLAVAALRRPPEPAPPPPPAPAPEPARSDEARVPVPDAVRTFLDGLPGPLLVIGGNGRVSYANAAADAALPNARAGSHFAHLIRAPAFVEAVAATLADGAPRSVEFASHQAADQTFEARVAQMPGTAAGGGAQAIVLLEDHTRSRRAEQLRSDFIANASHELRTPLATIIGYVETLQNHARDDAEARSRFLAIMAREAARMQRLVEDLMSLSRIEMNEHLRPAEVLPLARVAAESAAALQPLARQHGVALLVDLDPDERASRVLGDRDQLVQVFTNLIDNAINYGGTTVRVAAAAPSRANPNRLGIAVADDGPGIAREHLPRLTERFYRASIGQSRARGGTGLGLAIVKHILNRHRGRLEITSEIGTGSVFTVWLPAAPGAPERPGRPAGGAAENSARSYV